MAKKYEVGYIFDESELKDVADFCNSTSNLMTTTIESRKKEVEYDYRVYALKWEREKLYERINKRVDIMLEQGLIDEVKSKGYFYLGTDDLGEMAFLKACDDYNEFMSCRRVQ